MKVVHIITSLSTGGAEKLIVDSLPIYAKKVDVDLIVLKDIGKKSIFKDRLASDFVGEIKYLTTGSLYNPFLIFRIGLLLRHYELAHIHLFPTLYWAVLAKLFFGRKTKLVYTEHSTSNKRRDKKIFKSIERFIYSKLDFIGCISIGTKVNLLKHLGSKDENVQVISNGVDLEFFKNSNVQNYSFFDGESFVLIQISRFSVQKDQDTVVKALALLPFQFKLLLVGDGERRKDVERLVHELELENRVLFLGNRSDIPSLLKYSDVNILSSHYEGFGLTVVEGMAVGKPTIASNVDGVREILEGYGLLFEKGNAEELASLLLKLESEKEFYKEVGSSCLARAKEYDIRKMVDSYIKVYKGLF